MKRNWEKDLRTLELDKVNVKHNPMKPKYVRAMKDLQRVLTNSKVIAYRKIESPSNCVELSSFVKSLSGRRGAPGILCAIRVYYDENWLPIEGILFCYNDGLDETPIIKSISQAKAYLVKNFPSDCKII